MELDTSGVEYVNETDELLRTRAHTETITTLFAPKLATVLATMEESDIHTDIDALELN